MMTTPADIVKAALAKDAVKVTDFVADVLNQKAAEAIDAERANVVAQAFGHEPVEIEDPNIVPDDDEETEREGDEPEGDEEDDTDPEDDAETGEEEEIADDGENTGT